MPEETIWKGTSSQWKNCGTFVMLILSIPASIGLHVWLGDKGIVPWNYLLIVAAAFWAFWKWLQLKTVAYQITTERLITTSGIFTKVTDPLELYRVRDLRVVEPLFHRLLGLQNIEVITTDALDAEVVLDYVPAREKLLEQLRNCVETCRKVKGVRSVDTVLENPGDRAHDPGDVHPS